MSHPVLADHGRIAGDTPSDKVSLDVLKAEARERLAEESDMDLDESDTDHCIICLQPVEDRTVLINCAHDRMCFECIKKWTEQSRRCPLCNTPIGSHLIHSIRSEYDYQKHFLPPLTSSPPPTNIVTEARAAHRARTRRPSSVERDSLDRAIEKRRWVYRHGLFAKHIASNAHTRFRPHPTPQQISNSPELQSRCQMFVRRELRIWPNVDVEFLTSFILSLAKSLDIRSEPAVKLISEFLDIGARKSPSGGTTAEHFVHELYSYLRSPFRDLPAYDAVVQYDAPDDIETAPSLRLARRYDDEPRSSSRRDGPSSKDPGRREKFRRETSDPLEASPRDADADDDSEMDMDEEWRGPLPSSSLRDKGKARMQGERREYRSRETRRSEERSPQRSAERDGRGKDYERRRSYTESNERPRYHGKKADDRDNDRDYTRSRRRDYFERDRSGDGKRPTRDTSRDRDEDRVERRAQAQEQRRDHGRNTGPSGSKPIGGQGHTQHPTLEKSGINTHRRTRSSSQESDSGFRRHSRSSSRETDHKQPAAWDNHHHGYSVARPVRSAHRSAPMHVSGGGSNSPNVIQSNPILAPSNHVTLGHCSPPRPDFPTATGAESSGVPTRSQKQAPRLGSLASIRQHLQGSARPSDMPKTEAFDGRIKQATRPTTQPNDQTSLNTTNERSTVVATLSPNTVDPSSHTSNTHVNQNASDTAPTLASVSYSIRGAAIRSQVQPLTASDSTQRAQGSIARARLLARLEAAKSMAVDDEDSPHPASSHSPALPEHTEHITRLSATNTINESNHPADDDPSPAAQFDLERKLKLRARLAARKRDMNSVMDEAAR